jgi:hypothetical protein
MSTKKQLMRNTSAPNSGLVDVDTSNQANIEGKTYEETRDGFILGFNIAREVSEATDLLAPLKATSLLMIRGLEITKVSRVVV